MLLLRTPAKIVMELAIDNKNVAKYATAYLDNTGIGEQSGVSPGNRFPFKGIELSSRI